MAEPHRMGAVQLLAFSAASEAALERATDELAARLDRHADHDLSDLVQDLEPERPAMEFRRVVVAGHAATAAQHLRGRDPKRVFTGRSGAERTVVFMFAGVGDQYPGLAAGLYRRLPAFRQELDTCLRLLGPEVGLDLSDVLYPDGALTRRAAGERAAPDLARIFERPETADEISRTQIAQPLAFATQYAMARLLLALGVMPSVLLGYSVGEFVAACLAGVLTLECALRVVAVRARLIAGLSEGGMLAVASPAAPLEPFLGGSVSVAAIDGPGLTVLAGPAEDIGQLGNRLVGAGIACRPLPALHAFHSAMMEPVVAPLRELLSAVPLQPPGLPVLSNVTGTWMRAQEATSPEYWARQMRQPVRFAEDLAEVWRLPAPVLVELGPGQTLSRLALQSPARRRDEPGLVLPTLPGAFERRSDLTVFLAAIGRLWTVGARIKLSELNRA